MISEYIPKCTHCGTYAQPVCECERVAYTKKLIHGQDIFVTYANHLTDFIIVIGYFNPDGELVKTLPAPQLLTGQQNYVKGKLK
jgi:hypothetical protein